MYLKGRAIGFQVPFGGTRSAWTMNIRVVFMTSGKYKHFASIIVTCRSLTISDFGELRAEKIYHGVDLGDLQIGV